MQTTSPQKLWIALAGLLAITLGSASATLVIDLQASAVSPSLGTLSGDRKTIAITGSAGTVTLEVWAQVTATAPINNIFGVRYILGSIVSTSAVGDASGTMSVSTPAFPFNFGSQAGALAELSTLSDSVIDLGSNATFGGVSHIRFQKDPTSGGEQISTVFFATNNQPAGATFHPIPNGYEFLMGTATLTVSSFVQNTVQMNWSIPGFVSPVQKMFRAQWTDGDGIVNNGNTQASEMFVGTPVVLSFPVPEPSAFGMILMGAFTLAGFRRPLRPSA